MFRSLFVTLRAGLKTTSNLRKITQTLRAFELQF